MLKYVVKNQNEVDNIVALTLSSYTEKLEKQKEVKDERIKTQLVYDSIASMAYARANLHECSAVTAVHYLLHSTTFVCLHDFQTLYLGRHL